MTSERRLALVTALAARHAKANTASPAAAKKVLVREGIYTRSGDLSPNYGGSGSKTNDAKAADPS